MSVTALPGFVEAWDFTSYNRLWTDAGRTTNVTGNGDLVVVADGLSNTVAGRASNTGGSTRPVVVNGGLSQTSTAHLIAMLAASPATEITIGIRFLQKSVTTSTYHGLFCTSSTGQWDYIDGLALIPNVGTNAPDLRTMDLYTGTHSPGDLMTSTTPFNTFVNIIITRTATGNTLLYRDGVLETTLGASTVSVNLGLATFFTRYEANISNHSPTTIAKVFLGRTVLNTTDRNTLNSWLTGSPTRLWTPEDLGSKLYFRFNPATITGLTDNTNVTGWTSTGAQVFTVTPPVGESPKYRTSGDGGRPYVSWVGVNPGRLNYSAPGDFMTFQDAEGITYLASVRKSHNGRATIIGTGNIYSYPQFEVAGIGSVGTIQPGIWAGYATTTASIDDRILSLYRTNNTSAQAFAEVNGTVCATSYSYTSGGGTTPYTFTLGDRGSSGGSWQPFLSDLYDISVVRGEATLLERQKYAGWAAWNFGWTSFLPSDHPYKLAPPTVPITFKKSADQNNKKEGVDMPIYRGGTYRHQWFSETTAGAVNTTTKPVVKIKQNSGAAVTIDPSRVIHAGDGFWYVELSAFEMAYDYISFVATDASLATYAFTIKTDDATAAIYTMATDFTSVVRTWVLSTYNAVGAAGPTINAKIGGFTGTGSNTLLGFLLAVLRKNAPLPSDIGGTYAVATDSQEALQEQLSGISGGGGGGGVMTIDKLVTSTKYQLSNGQVQAIGTAGQKVRLDVSSGTIGLIVGVANNIPGAPVVAEQRNVGEHSFELTDTSYAVALSKSVSFNLSVIT
jgi:hypothetical protein